MKKLSNKKGNSVYVSLTRHRLSFLGKYPIIAKQHSVFWIGYIIYIPLLHKHSPQTCNNSLCGTSFNDFIHFCILEHLTFDTYILLSKATMTSSLSARIKMTLLFFSVIKILVSLAKSNNFLSTSLWETTRDCSIWEGNDWKPRSAYR